MDEKKFNEIEKILSEVKPNSEGVLEVLKGEGVDLIDFSNLSYDEEEIAKNNKKDFLIHVKYIPEKGKYGFCGYIKEGEK